MASLLFSTKPIGELDEADTANELHRTLDVRALVLLGIGAIIGTGIFVLTGTAAANHAGPALVVSFLNAGLGCTLAGLCYAEFAAMIPVSGSACSYSYATLGEFVAWFIGWNLILEYLLAASTVAVGWSGYVVALVEQFGCHLPDAFSNAPLAKGQGHFEIVRTGALVNLPAVLVVAAITALCYVGIHPSARFNAIVVAIKVTVIALFIGLGTWVVDGANGQPFIPENPGTFGKFGWSGVVQAAGIILFAYIGFDAVSTAAQEAKNPQRDTPAPVALTLDRHPELNWLAGWIKLGAIAGMASVRLVMMLGQPRIFYAMSRDGRMPPVFRRVHPTHKTPDVGTLITGTLAALIAGLFPVTPLGELVSIGTLLAFTTVCIGVLALHRTRPDIPRPFSVTDARLVCIAGAMICTVMMVSLPKDTWVRLLGWTAFGLAIYAFYGYRHSELREIGR